MTISQSIGFGREPSPGALPARFYRFVPEAFTPGIDPKFFEESSFATQSQTGRYELEWVACNPSLDLYLGFADPFETNRLSADILEAIFMDVFRGIQRRTNSTIALLEETGNFFVTDTVGGLDQSAVNANLELTRGDTTYKLNVDEVVNETRLRVSAQGSVPLAALAAGESTLLTGMRLRNGNQKYTHQILYKKGDLVFILRSLVITSATVESKGKGLMVKLQFTGAARLLPEGDPEPTLINAPITKIRPDHGGQHWMTDEKLLTFDFSIGAPATLDRDLFDPVDAPSVVFHEKFAATGNVTNVWRTGAQTRRAFAGEEQAIRVHLRPREGATPRSMEIEFPHAVIHNPDVQTTGNLEIEKYQFTATGHDHTSGSDTDHLAELTIY